MKLSPSLVVKSIQVSEALREGIRDCPSTGNPLQIKLKSYADARAEIEASCENRRLVVTLDDSDYVAIVYEDQDYKQEERVRWPSQEKVNEWVRRLAGQQNRVSLPLALIEALEHQNRCLDLTIRMCKEASTSIIPELFIRDLPMEYGKMSSLSHLAADYSYHDSSFYERAGSALSRSQELAVSYFELLDAFERKVTPVLLPSGIA